LKIDIDVILTMNMYIKKMIFAMNQDYKSKIREKCNIGRNN